MLIRHDFVLKILLKILLNKIFARRERKSSETFIWNINSNILLLKYPSLQRLVGNVCRLHARAGSLLKSTVVDKWNTLARPNPYAPQVQLVFKSIIPEDICDHKDSKFGWIWNSSNLLLLNSSLLLSQFDNKVTTERIHNKFKTIRWKACLWMPRQLRKNQFADQKTLRTPELSNRLILAILANVGKSKGLPLSLNRSLLLCQLDIKVSVSQG